MKISKLEFMAKLDEYAARADEIHKKYGQWCPEYELELEKIRLECKQCVQDYSDGLKNDQT